MIHITKLLFVVFLWLGPAAGQTISISSPTYSQQCTAVTVTAEIVPDNNRYSFVWVLQRLEIGDVSINRLL